MPPLPSPKILRGYFGAGRRFGAPAGPAGARPLGTAGDLGALPSSVRNPLRSPSAIQNERPTRRPLRSDSCAFLLIAYPVRRLQVRPICGCSFGGGVRKLPPLRHRPDLVNDEAQRMPGIARLVVVDRTTPPAADPARRPHGLEPGPVLSAQVPVLVPRIRRHASPPPPVNFRRYQNTPKNRAQSVPFLHPRKLHRRARRYPATHSRKSAFHRLAVSSLTPISTPAP